MPDLIPAQPLNFPSLRVHLVFCAKKYEKKQIWLHGRQDSECTLLKCYLGFGNCGLGGLFGQNERGRGREKEAYRRHIYTKGSASARGFICESSSEIAADWVRVMRLQQPAWSNQAAELLLIPDSIVLTWLQLQYGHTQAEWARESGANLTTAKEWKVFHSFLRSKSLLSLKPFRWQPTGI